jgi:hypothetical protein
LGRQNSNQKIEKIFKLGNKEIKDKLMGNTRKEDLKKFLAGFILKKNKYLYNWNMLFKKEDEGILNKSIRQRKCIVNLGRISK